MAEKNEEFTNISIEEAVKKLQSQKDEILDAFAKAYLADSGLLPTEVELVTQQMPMKDGIIEHVYFFRKKDEDRG